jgi:hypothetical protein
MDYLRDFLLRLREWAIIAMRRSAKPHTFVPPQGIVIVPEVLPETTLQNICIYDGERMVGRALVVELPKDPTPILVDIYIYHEADRRKGHGDAAMRWLCANLPAMKTSFLSNAGRELCLKHGFVWKRSLFKKQPDVLTYTRKG